MNLVQLEKMGRCPPAFSINNNVIILRESDGDSSRRPKPDKSKPTQPDIVNVHLPADELVEREWKLMVGSYLVYVHIGVDDLYLLRDFPSGYALFTHKKGPKGEPRFDHYLYGSNRVYRSPAEFIPHAEWLSNGRPRARDGSPLCACTYCSGEKQGIISKRIADRWPGHWRIKKEVAARPSRHAQQQQQQPAAPPTMNVRQISGVGGAAWRSR